MANLIELLKETLIAKSLSPERAAAIIGCSGQTIRRWLKNESIPTLIYRKALEEGIKRINCEVPEVRKINKKEKK